MASGGATIGTRIAKRRQVLRLTQSELAAQLGVSKSTVTNWETGKHYPLRYMGRLEAVLGISLDDGQEPPFVPADDDEARIWAMDEPEEWRHQLIAWKRASRAAG